MHGDEAELACCVESVLVCLDVSHAYDDIYARHHVHKLKKWHLYVGCEVEDERRRRSSRV